MEKPRTSSLSSKSRHISSLNSNRSSSNLKHANNSSASRDFSGDTSNGSDNTSSSDKSPTQACEPLDIPRRSTDTKYGSEKPRLWQSGEPYKFAPQMTSDPWEELIKEVKKYDKEEVEGWREDIDTLLVFAGLFSAAVTAFTVESYQWLQRDPMDTTTQLLYQMTLQLGNPNLTVPVDPSQEKFNPENSSVRINILWFLSLILSLSSALLSILCKQWLREYCRDTWHTKTQMQALVLRQLRYTSFEKWHVRTFITSLPLLLELALLLFFAGILELLWNLHTTVAVLATAIIGCTVIFFFVTAMLPSYSFLKMVPEPPISDEDKNHSNSDLKTELTTFCPYKSPLAWLFFRVFRLIYGFLSPSTDWFSKITNWSRGDLEIIKDSPYHNKTWGYYYLPGHGHLQLLDLGLKWVVDAFGDSARMAGHIFHCLTNLEGTLPSEAYLQSLRSVFEASRSTPMVVEEVPSQIMFRFLHQQYYDGNDLFLGELTLRALNEASIKTPEYVYQYLQTGSLYITFLFEHVLSLKPESPEIFQEVIYQVESSIFNSISSHMGSRSSNNINLLVLELCEKIATYKDPSIDESILAILEFMLGKMEEEIHVRPLLNIRSHLLDVIGNFVFRHGGVNLTVSSDSPTTREKAQNVISKLKNLLVKDSLRWETVSIFASPMNFSGDDASDSSRVEWEEFWEDYIRTDYILPNSGCSQRSVNAVQ